MVGLLLSWLVLPRIGVDGNVTAVLIALSLLAIVLGPVTRAIQGGSRARLERIYVDAGFESSEPRGLKPREAEALIEAPGTVARATAQRRAALTLPGLTYDGFDQVVDGGSGLRHSSQCDLWTTLRCSTTTRYNRPRA